MSEIQTAAFLGWVGGCLLMGGFQGYGTLLHAGELCFPRAGPSTWAQAQWQLDGGAGTALVPPAASVSLFQNEGAVVWLSVLTALGSADKSCHAAPGSYHYQIIFCLIVDCSYGSEATTASLYFCSGHWSLCGSSEQDARNQLDVPDDSVQVLYRDIFLISKTNKQKSLKKSSLKPVVSEAIW